MGYSGGNYGNVNVKGLMNVVVLSLALSVSVNCSIVVFFPFRDLVAPGQSLNALLMKFARSSTDVTGVKVYNSKKLT